jgi:guanylate kinase
MTLMTQPVSHPLLVLISAPSGSGKTTVCQRLLAGHPGRTRAVTCTTRTPRGGEQDGIDYHFLDEKEFERRIEAGGFLEHAQVYGHHYGTTRDAVVDGLRRGLDVLLSVDVQGADSIRAAAVMDNELGRALVSVFLAPPTLGELEARLRGRGTEGEDTLRRRLGAARRELECWRRFDYLVVSGSMAEDVRRIEVILEAERMRQKRVGAPAWEADAAGNWRIE